MGSWAVKRPEPPLEWNTFHWVEQRRENTRSLKHGECDGTLCNKHLVDVFSNHNIVLTDCLDLMGRFFCRC